MGTNQSTIKRYMVMKVEGTAGTEAAPSTTEHVIRFRDIEYTPTIEMDDENSKYANGNHGEDEAIAGNQSVQITCSAKVTYGGAVTTEPHWWTAAKACGCESIGWSGGSETTTAGAVEGLGLVGRKDADDNTYTIWVFEEEIGSAPVTTILKAVGCVGNMVISADATGQTVKANFTFTGKLTDIVDGTAVAINASTQTQLADPYLNSATTIHGGAVCVDAWQFDMGNEVSPLKCQSDATGIKHYFISARRPRLSMNPLAVKQATKDWLATILAETTGAVVIPIGTNLKLNISDAQVMSPGVSTRDGLTNWDLNLRCLQNGSPGSLTDSALTLEDTFEMTNGART